jgi:phosphomannomutase
VFPTNIFTGLKIVLYQHSSVGRDIMKEIFGGLGAMVIAPEEDIEVEYVHEVTGEGRKDNVKLRSEKFIPVDTEKVTNKNKAVLKQMAEIYHPDVIISADGDGDRPLLVDEHGKFLPGDKLGALASMYLKPYFVAIPISSNDAVVDMLKAKKIKVKRTKIGSPYVIKAMNDELAKHPREKVASWEVNGGFLTGSDWTINDQILKALPTRDSILPLIATVLLMKENKVPISRLIKTKLPSWETQAGVIDDKTPGCESYTTEMGKSIIEKFSPKDSQITEVKFMTEVEAVNKDGENRPLTKELGDDMIYIKKQLEPYFTKARGFNDIVAINYIDGIKIIFANNEVSHLRPSGNAPEFRNYSQAATKERANEIVKKRFEILPEIIADMSMTYPQMSGERN